MSAYWEQDEKTWNDLVRERDALRDQLARARGFVAECERAMFDALPQGDSGEMMDGDDYHEAIRHARAFLAEQDAPREVTVMETMAESPKWIGTRPAPEAPRCTCGGPLSWGRAGDETHAPDCPARR